MAGNKIGTEIIMEDIIIQSLRKQFFHYKIIQLDNKSLQKLEEMILFDIIRLEEIPVNIRVSNKGLYIMALRADAISSERYKEDLKLLESDALYLKETAESLSKLHEDMERSITRCWDYQNVLSEETKENLPVTGGEN